VLPPGHAFAASVKGGDVGQKEVKSYSLIAELLVFISEYDILGNNMKIPVVS
jgi:hypothetical protein